MSGNKDTIKGLEYLREQLGMADKVVGQFKDMEKGHDAFINEVMSKLPDEQRQQLTYFKAQANRAINMAKNGNGSYEDVLAKARETFDKMNKDGSNNNG
jgi:hypothetical protein